MSDLSDINKSDTDSDESVSEVVFTIRELATAESLACCCYEIDDSDLALMVIKDMIEDCNIQCNLSCKLDNIIRVINFFIDNHTTLDDYRRLALADLFYRLRHELLFKALCLYLNLPEVKSDTPFSHCGISSNRTPDLIIHKDDIYYIFEVTASSSIERAAMSKGLEEAGFESKYQKELSMLDDKGIAYKYIPVLFDMNDPNGEDYMKQLSKVSGSFKFNEIGESIMHFIKKEIALITVSSKVYFAPMATMLFSKNIPIIKDHKELEFLYDTEEVVAVNSTYTEICVSPQVYNKINLTWYRIIDIIERVIESNDDKVKLVLDLSKHRVEAIRDPSGENIEFFQEIINKYDKCSLFKNLKLKHGNTYKDCINSETGVRFIEKSYITPKSQSCGFLVTSNNHTLTRYTPSEDILRHSIDTIKYEGLIKDYFDNRYFSKDYHPLYEDELFYKTSEFDKECGPDYENSLNLDLLSDMNTKDINIEKLTNDLITGQIKANLSEEGVMPLKQNKCKPPFLLPVCNLSSNSYCSIKEKNTSFLTAICQELGNENPYTELILSSALSEDFEFYTNPNIPSKQLQKLMSERAKLSQKMSQLQAIYYRKMSAKKGRVRLSECADPEILSQYKTLSSQISKLSKEIRDRKKIEKVQNETSLIRLPTKNKGGHLRQLYQKEMSHFRDKNKQSTISGVGIRRSINSDYEHDFSVFNEMMIRMCDYRGENPDLFFENVKTDDAKLLTDLKNLAVERYSRLINEVKNSLLGHSAAFISRLAHSLLYYSQMPFTSDYIRVDNLGYKDCLLIVKGGKKIFKSKSSKFYRLIYPMNDFLETWYDCGHADKGSTRIMVYKDRKYIITPWQQMHESVLNDSISFYPRVVSFTVLNLNPEASLKSQFKKVGLNVMLSYHNRRQTEVFLANMRYILLSTLGDFTGITKIFNEFVGFNYDCFQSFVRSSVILNYQLYFRSIAQINAVSIKKQINFSHFLDARVHNLFTGEIMKTEEELAMMIYCTFLMTKAPYQRPVERSINLKSILNIHSYYESKVGLKLSLEEQYNRTTVHLREHDKYSSYIQDLFSNDFNIDPGYCAQIGVFADSYFKNRGLTEELHTLWISTINKCWDEMARSTGLRGNYDEVEDFWGQKGYFVVYKEFVKDPEFIKATLLLMNENVDSDTKRKCMRSLNELYKDKVQHQPEFLIFHAVDKVQWRGSREIYVMDINTKAMQQPIENFMGEVCKLIDNELISIPSNKRSQVIHHAIFEKDLPMKDTLTWYLTLDCTKWAPKSNFIKFAITIINMSCMPPSFKTHFLNYLEKLEKKRVYFNTAEVQVLSNNMVYKPIVDKYLLYDEKVKGYYLEMEYSWVMGIFNYTSSFLHAFNQKYCSYFLFKSSLDNYQEETSLVMFAHSDDSGGRLTSSSFSLIKRAVFLYEVHLKKCNHLLSKKKSVISRIYFEILSIIYIFKKLLALLPKFLGGLRFLPTDKGPSQDLMQSYSKCIEVMVAGADFSVAYLVMKFYSYMVWRFYFPNKKPSEINFKVPVQYLGLPDSHPLMVLICGSDSDIVRQIHTGGSDRIIKTHSFVNNLFSTIDEDGPIKCLKFKINVRGLKKGFEGALESLKMINEVWSLGNVNYHSTPMNLMSFLKKLNDPGFIGSLVNESTVRRLSRSYFIRSGDSCVTKFGMVKLGVLYESIITFVQYSDTGSAIYKLFNDVLSDEDLENLNKDIYVSSGYSKMQIEVLEHLLSSPLKISKYLENLTMENRSLTCSTRTLKPTHVCIQKSSKTFSIKFDPAQLVSFIKEPEWSWALPNPRSLFTAKEELVQICKRLRFEPELLSCDTLLRLCRGYSVMSTKDIYIYSHVPSEVRQIRTYSSLLTFLSVNTIKNQEIVGLVLQLKAGVVDPQYIPSDIDEDVYTLNCCISLISTILRHTDVEFISFLTVKPLEEYGWEGGSVIQFLNFVSNYKFEDPSYNLIMPNISVLTNNIQNPESEHSMSYFQDSSFYVFTKSQKQRGGWFGSGEVLFYLQRDVIIFELYNNSIVSVKTNVVGKIKSHHANFLNDTFNKINITLKPPRGSKIIRPSGELLFGIDMSGCLSISNQREVTAGHPVEIISGYPGIINNMSLFRIRRISYDCFLAETDDAIDSRKYKIYTISVPTNEIVTMAKRSLDPEQFKSRVLEVGSDSFEDFLLTEIMTDYGSETYVNFDEFVDNFTASETYNILKTVKEKSISTLPKRMSCSTIPAQSGSLLRILIDYSNFTGEQVIKSSYNVNPEMMALRSEYPEEMSVILSENLEREYKSLYNLKERSEIESSYCKLFNLTDKDKIRVEIVKLMRYWGYSSLVNTIETFSFSKESRNFDYFNLSVLNAESKAYFSKLIINFSKSVSKSMMIHSRYYDGLELPLPFLKNKGGVKEVIYNQEMSLVLNCYGFQSYFKSLDIYHVQYLNTFIAYLKDDDFCTTLSNVLSEDPVLCSLPIEYKYRKDLVAVYNTLRCSWLKSNSVPILLNYSVKLQRLKSEIRPPITLFNELATIKRSPNSVYYHGFMNQSLYNYLNESFEIQMNQQIWRVRSKIKGLSDQRVPLTKLFTVEMPLKEEIFESEDWEELICECEMADLDEDTILEYWEGFEDKYVKSTFKEGKIEGGKTLTRFDVTWLILPFLEGSVGFTDYIRQAGENIVVLSNMYIEQLNYLPNCEIRLINFSDAVQERLPNMVMHICVDQRIPSVFWDKAFGGSKLRVSKKLFDLVYYNQIRISRGVITDPSGMGVKIDEDIMTRKVDINKVDEIGIIESEEDDDEFDDDDDDNSDPVYYNDFFEVITKEEWDKLQESKLPKLDISVSQVELLEGQGEILRNADAVKKCSSCGLEYEEGSEICPSCKNTLKECEGCHELYTDDHGEEPSCSYTLVKCNNCNLDFKEGSNYCSNCGGDITEDGSVPQERSETPKFASTSGSKEVRINKRERDKLKIKECIDEALKNGVISDSLYEGLMKKYLPEEKVEVNLESLLKSCITEIGLMSAKSDILNNLMDLTKDDYVKMFQSPEYFGLSYKPSRRDSKSIKSGKIRAELGSIHNDIPSLLGSGTLTISRSFKKQILSYCKMWDNMAKYTNYKKDNKRFLISLIKCIFNSSAEVESSEDDSMWQDLSNRVSLYITEDPDTDEEEDNEFDFITEYTSGARLKYKPVGH
jgi:hypothetical protein